MDLNILWFILIGVLYIAYFVLEGFDLGVGILLPFLGKSDTERRVLINTIGPHWDGNEVWLLTAGGATFAAFPQWYATLFSGFYLPLFLILIALIFRGVAFEFRSRDDNKLWRAFWDWAIFFGSLIPALLWGVAFANMVVGVPIDASMQYTGGFWNLLNPFALLAGIVSLLGFTLHGAMYLSLKTTGNTQEKVEKVSKTLWLVEFLAFAFFVVASYQFVPLFKGFGFNAGLALIVALLLLTAVRVMLAKKRSGWAFAFSAAAILVTTAAVFWQLFPNVMISSTDPLFNLTIYNASSSSYTLSVMAKIALVMVPIVLIYTAWSYWVFRKRVTGKVEELKY
ncbi:MAG: cytochrome d ubiquinol oxidase subunit II [Anaerolineaceae bacterium]